MADAEQERQKVPKDADDVPVVPLPTHDHVVFQDVHLGPGLNLGLDANSISLIIVFWVGHCLSDDLFHEDGYMHYQLHDPAEDSAQQVELQKEMFTQVAKTPSRMKSVDWTIIMWTIMGH